MTRKDFELIAETIRNAEIPDECRSAIASAFSMRLASTNPRFDAGRFHQAATGRAG